MEEALSYRDQNLERVKSILSFIMILQYYEYSAFYFLRLFKMFFGL